MSKETCNASIFKPISNWWAWFILLIIYAPIIVILAILSLFSKEARCSLDQILFRLKYWREGNTDRSINLSIWNASTLRRWLENHGSFHTYLVWEKGDGAGSKIALPFNDWSLGERYELFRAYYEIDAGRQLNLPEAPPVTTSVTSTGRVYETLLEPDDARNYFLASVALSFYNDLTNRYNWSITDASEYTESQIRRIFDSRYFFNYDPSNGKYSLGEIRIDDQWGVDSTRKNGYATIGDPQRILDYLETNGIVGNSRMETIRNMMAWCRDNLRHFTGSTTPSNLDDHWQYNGFAPVERVLNGTTQTSDPQDGVQHYTSGCWGTSGFLKIVMRTVNIPVQFLSIFTHAQVCFMKEQLYLSHSDDPYNSLSSSVVPPYPGIAILIDEAKYHEWFDYDTSDLDSRIEANNNIGRRTTEIALKYDSLALISTYCADMANGLSHADGQVLTTLNRGDSGYYTLADLENVHDIWTKMDNYLASIGGCANLNYP